MMARFRAEQAVLQSEQSLVLVPHEEVCKSREILGMFCTAWLLQGPKLQGKQSRGALLGGLAAHSLAYCQSQLIYHAVKKRN